MTVVDGPQAGSTLLRHALAIAARGWHVFPCAIDGKRPALRENWQHVATTDRARIYRWWTRAPFNIGIACGPSGLVVIDLDIPKDDSDGSTTGIQSLTELCELHSQPYPSDTLTVTTPSSGTHLYFRAPASPVRNSAGYLGPHIDVRATGGYVLAPDSRIGHRTYEVANAACPTPLPSWIASLLGNQSVSEAAPSLLPGPGIRRANSYALAALRGEITRVATSRPGTRNDTLNRAAFSLGQLVAANLLPAEVVSTALADAAERCGLPGIEAHHTIRSGIASGLQHPRPGTLGNR